MKKLLKGEISTNKPETQEYNNNTFVDIFAGCGGFSLGLTQAGWKGLFAIEKDKLAFETFKFNFIDGNHIPKYQWLDWLPQKEISIENFMKKYSTKIRKLRGRVSIVVGGPPCQGFSFVGNRNKDDPRNSLINNFLHLVKEISPSMVIIENVKGIEHAFRNQHEKENQDNTPASKEIIQKLSRLNYVAEWNVFNSNDYGIPQKRPRSILFGIKRNLLASESNFDPVSHMNSAQKDLMKKKGLPTKNQIDVLTAISDLETAYRVNGKVIEKPRIPCIDSEGYYQIEYQGPQTKYQRILHKNMNGRPMNSLRLVKHRRETIKRFQHILDNCDKGVSISKYIFKNWNIRKNCLGILDPHKPSWTITTIPDDMIHYNEPRVLTVRELARLQSFPDWFEFKGKYTTGGKLRVNECPRYTQVGNAVPPFLAEAIGIAAKNILKNSGDVE